MPSSTTPANMRPLSLALLLLLTPALAAASSHYNALELLGEPGAPEWHPGVRLHVTVGSPAEAGAPTPGGAGWAGSARNSAWVTVRWEGLPEPALDDWVGLLVPSPVAAGGEVVAKYKMLWEAHGNAPGAWRKGEGELRFQVLNHRAKPRFVLFRGGVTRPRAVAASQQLDLLEPNVPSHLHMTLTGDPTQMLLQWVTRDMGAPAARVWREDEGAAREPPRRGLGAERGENEPQRGPAGARQGGTGAFTVTAASMSYGPNDMCGEPAKSKGFVPPGRFHYVLLEGLTPGAVYNYSVGDLRADAPWSEPRRFRAAPAPGSSGAVRLLAVADMGQAEADGSNEQCEMRPSANTTRLMTEEFDRALQQGREYGLVLHNGDISYARGYVTQWDNFMMQIEGLASRAPYMVAIGNHERDWPATGDRFSRQSVKPVLDSGGECGVAHERRFLMPTMEQDSPWYSFDYGPIHFLQYSTEHDTNPGSPQHDFLSADLASVDRSVTPWVIVGGHRPLYICSTFVGEPDGDQTVAAALRGDIEPLLLRYGVDMTLHGHHHSYQRTCPVAEGECVGYDDEGVARGPVHLVIGNAGAELTKNLEDPPPPIWEAIHMWWGFTRLEANATHLEFEALDDATGEVHDSIALRKPPGWGRTFHSRNGPASTPAHRNSGPWWANHQPTTSQPPANHQWANHRQSRATDGSYLQRAENDGAFHQLLSPTGLARAAAPLRETARAVRDVLQRLVTLGYRAMMGFLGRVHS